MDESRDEQGRWDAVAERYAEITSKDEPTKYFTARKLLEVVPRQGRTLEMGCGDGYITEYLARHCSSLTVVDASRAQLDSLRERIPGLHCVCSLFEDYAPDEPFDSIVAAHVLEHVADPVSVLEQLKGWLGPHGKLHVVVPNAESLNRRLGLKMGVIKAIDELGPDDLAIGHRRIYTLALLREHLDKADCAIESVSGIFIKPLSARQMRGWDREVLHGLYELSRDLPPQLASELYLGVAPRY